MKTISFIIPCYRSENTISAVVEEINQEMEKLASYDYEIITVNDNSPDNLQSVLEKLSEDQRIKVVTFSKNFGQHSGMVAGTHLATGDMLVYLDDDGQCPLDHLKEMIDPLESGYDVAIARYGKKKQSVFKNFCSFINEVAANILIDKPQDIQMGNFIAINRVMMNEICNYKGPYPYISGLLFRATNKVINVPMEERSRLVGGTTYTLRKLFNLWLNSFTAFSVKPLRFAIFLGSICAGGGLVWAVTIIVRKLINPNVAAGWSSLMSVNLLLGGTIILVLGIIGEYIGRIYMSLNSSPQYVIKYTKNI